MKILLLATVYEYGGISNVIRNILDHLDKERDEVVFLVERLASRHYPLRSDIKFINMDLETGRGIFGKLINILKHLCRLRKIIIKESPDVVLGFGSSVNCLYLLSFLWPAKNAPKVIFADYTEMLFVKQKARTTKESVFNVIFRAIMFFLYHRADAIVCVSRSLASHMEKFLFMDKNKIKVIPLPVNIGEIRLRSQEEISGYRNSLPWIGTVSRLSVEKGVNFLIDAFFNLARKIDARLIIVGDGEERENLEDMVRRLNIESKVEFLGWLDNPYKYLRKMDVFVLSSLWEGFPYVIVESMVCRVPVVASDSVASIREVLKDGVSGLLVSPKDSNALSDSIYKLLKDSDLRSRFVSEAAKGVEIFDAKKIVKRYRALMADVVI